MQLGDQTDGSIRAEDCAAAAFIVGLWSPDGNYQPLLAHGTFLKQAQTVFMLDATALDEAGSAVEHLLSVVTR